jgi:hypothetical protein
MASGDTNSAWTVYANEPPTSNVATRAQLVPTGDRARPVLVFASTGSPEAVFSGKLLNYGNSGVTVRIHGAMDGANTGTKVVRMEAAFERLPSGEALGGNGFASAVAAESTVDNTANNLFIASINLSNGAQIDSTVNDDWFRLRIARLNSGLTGDNASGNFRVLYVEVVEQ